MSQAISGINQAIHIRNAPIQAATQVAVAKKSLEATEGVGESVIQLLDQVGQLTQNAGPVGQNIDVRV